MVDKFLGYRFNFSGTKQYISFCAWRIKTVDNKMRISNAQISLVETSCVVKLRPEWKENVHEFINQ